MSTADIEAVTAVPIRAGAATAPATCESTPRHEHTGELFAGVRDLVVKHSTAHPHQRRLVGLGPGPNSASGPGPFTLRPAATPVKHGGTPKSSENAI